MMVAGDGRRALPAVVRKPMRMESVMNRLVFLVALCLAIASPVQAAAPWPSN